MMLLINGRVLKLAAYAVALLRAPYELTQQVRALDQKVTTVDQRLGTHMDQSQGTAQALGLELVNVRNTAQQAQTGVGSLSRQLEDGLTALQGKYEEHLRWHMGEASKRDKP